MADMEETRERLLGVTLAHVPFDGWTRIAMAAGARDLGLAPEDAALAFPGGALEMIDLHGTLADARMVAAMAARGVADMKVRARIALGVRLRLEQNAEHREAVRRAVAVLALPWNAAATTRLLYRTVDAIWHAAGDTATDYNFYTKRGLLAGVYTATLLFWLDDESEDFVESWAFLDRRIAEVLRVPAAIDRLTARLGDLPNPLRLFARGPRRAGYRFSGR